MINFLKKNKLNIIVIFVFLILPFIFFRDVFNINSIILGGGDSWANSLPMRQLRVDLIKNFEPLFWNKYNYCGLPFMGSIAANVLYPITLIYDLIFPIVSAYNLSLIFHYFLAGISMYCFLKEYKLSKFACFMSGLIFMFGGTMTTHRTHSNFIFTIAWIPLIFLFLEKYRKSKRFEFILISSIIYSISFFGGHPQIFLYSSMIILVFILYYTFIFKGGKNHYFLLSLLIFLISFLIISIQFIPAYELMKNSFRESIDYEFFQSFSFNPRLLPILFFPFFFGNQFYQVQNVPIYFGPWNFAEMAAYFGISSIPFLIFGLFKRSKHKYLWIFILILSFFLVLGSHFPLYKLIYYIPLINKFRVPARNWFGFGLAFSILAGFGFDYFIRLKIERIKRIVLGSIAFLSFIFSGFFIFYLIFNSNLKDKIMNFFANDFKVEYLKESIKLTNYSIYIPLLIIFLTIIILILTLFKKNKFVYIFIIMVAILDLFSFTYFYGKTTDVSYVYEKKEDYSNYNFISEDTDIYRIYPIPPEDSGLRLTFYQNIFKRIDSITGYDPTMIEDYKFISGINESSFYEGDFQELLKNNNILSMLNVKYIIIPNQNNINELKDNISKSFWRSTTSIINNELYGERKSQIFKLTHNKGIILVNGSENTYRVFKIQVDIKSNKDYLVSFELKSNEILGSNIYFDFFREEYSNSEQKFYLTPGYIRKDEYVKVEKIFNSGELTSNNAIYFRIYTSSDEEITIKNLEIYEVELARYENYEILYSNGAIILENKNFIPRFYFVESVKGINDLEEIKEILWDSGINKDWEKFDPKKTALVQGVDFNKVNFNIENSNVKIIEYKNNRIKIETSSIDVSFLIFSDTYYPGWKAYIDNNETKIYRVNGILKGIYIPNGNHTVVLKYIPSYFWSGAIISLVSFILVLLLLIILLFRRKKLINKNYSYGFFVSVFTIGFFLDNFYKKLNKKRCIKTYRIVFISIIILLLISTIIFYRGQVKTIINSVKYNYSRIFHKEIYYSNKEEIVIGGELFREKIKISIDYPKAEDVVSGVFKLEGWAIEQNISIEDSVIDFIDIFLDGEPSNGKYIGRTETNILRSELGEIYGKQFDYCGFRFFIDSKKFGNGKHTIYIYAHNEYFGWDFICIDINVDN